MSPVGAADVPLASASSTYLYTSARAAADPNVPSETGAAPKATTDAGVEAGAPPIGTADFPLANLSQEQLTRFNDGDRLFKQALQSTG